MNIDEFRKVAKGKSKSLNEESNLYLSSMIDEISSQYNVNKTVAKYILLKTINYNVVKADIAEQIDYLNENDMIFEDDQ
jgi:hypothetical protein